MIHRKRRSMTSSPNLVFTLHIFLRTVILCKLLERELESWGGVINSQYFNRKGEPSIRMNEHGFPRIAWRKMT